MAERKEKQRDGAATDLNDPPASIVSHDDDLVRSQISDSVLDRGACGEFGVEDEVGDVSNASRQIEGLSGRCNARRGDKDRSETHTKSSPDC